MRRTITGFHRDDAGDWVADLSCLHRQHIRHRPPFRNAPWIDDEQQRSEKLGSTLDCPLCDRAEMPEGLRPTRTTPLWSRETAPLALRRDHTIAPGVWGLLRVQSGRLRFIAETEPLRVLSVYPAQAQPIPPEVRHHVELPDEVSFRIEFFTRWLREIRDGPDTATRPSGALDRRRATERELARGVGQVLHASEAFARREMTDAAIEAEMRRRRR